MSNPSETMQNPVIDWAAVQAELDRGEGGGSQWLFPSKNPNLKVHLLSPGDPAQLPYAEVNTSYQGKDRSKYLMYCTEAPNGPIKVLVLPRTAFRSIVALLSNGWDLMSPKTGIPVILSKYQIGSRTSYTAVPFGAQPMVVSDEIVEELKGLTLAQAVQDFNDWQSYMASRGETANGDH